MAAKPASKTKKKVKAILFVPQGRAVARGNLDVEVVSVKAKDFTTLAMRRC